MSHDNGQHDDATLPPGWTEANMSRLLDRFFAAEMQPPRETVTMPALVAAQAVPTSRRSADRWVLPVCGVAVLSCGWLLSLSPVAVIPVASNGNSPLRVELEAAGIPFRTELVSFAGETGVFAQRNEWRRTTHESFDPQSGTWVEWTTAELSIEVEPVEQFEDDPRREQGL